MGEIMSDGRQDPKQVDAFRSLARRIAHEQSGLKFEDALRRLMTPAPEPDEAVSNTAAAPQPPSILRAQTVKA
jgi:hypothetical protein